MDFKEKRLFSELPSRSKITTEKNFVNFGANIKNIYNPDTQSQFYNIAKTIYNKLDVEDPEWAWDLSDYGKFKLIFTKIAIKEFDVFNESIQKCLDAATSEIYRELQNFSQECEWYRLLINKKEKSKENNVIIKRGIHLTDCFLVITTLQSYMYKNIFHAIPEFNEEESINEIINALKKDESQFLQKFELEFSFIKKYPLFKDIYNKMYKKSIEKLISFTYMNYGIKKMNEDIRKQNQGVANSLAKKLGNYEIQADIKNGHPKHICKK